MNFPESFMIGAGFHKAGKTSFHRHFEALGIMVVADFSNFTLYALKFAHEEEMVSFLAGDFMVIFTETDRHIYRHFPCRLMKKIDLLDAISIEKMQTKKHFLDAMRKFERTYIDEPVYHTSS